MPKLIECHAGHSLTCRTGPVYEQARTVGIEIDLINIIGVVEGEFVCSIFFKAQDDRSVATLVCSTKMCGAMDAYIVVCWV